MSQLELGVGQVQQHHGPGDIVSDAFEGFLSHNVSV